MSTYINQETSCFKGFETKEGRGGNLPLQIYKESKCIEDPSNGAFKAQSSYNKTPRDQTSDLKLYGQPSIISGLK